MELSQLLQEFNELYGNNRDKGTKFELVIKDYLLTEPMYSSKIEIVWTWSEFPYRGNIGDTGIDLVAKTFDNEFWAIQCKFYEPNHYVSKGDVDTFLATSSKYFYVNDEATNYSYRMIISTSDKYSKNAEDALLNQTPEVIRIGMSDLLESSIDWDKFVINNKVSLKEKYSPRPHQRQAINAVVEGFKTSDRGKLIMACGTGKTFTSLRCTEELLNGTGNILFLVPSIALINQTLTEWSSQANYSFNALVVCSDNKASKGEESIDLKIPSTTDINRISQWIDYTKNNERNFNFIFSTYQSIDVVSNMQKTTNFHFDLIICDEAHRTTGVTLANDDESYFVKVHNNDFIEADKRLYMTATPRIYGDNVKTKAHDSNAELCSMDDITKYGPEFFNLTFSQAVSKGLLTDYKVLVLAVDEEYVKAQLQDLLTDENHEMKLDDTVKIMGCWNGLSKKTISPKDDSFSNDPVKMKRAVAFCNRIKDSQLLVDMFKTIQDYVSENDPEEKSKLVDIEIEHVDGTFNALEKKEKINWLKDSSGENTCRILTNARCLSEGVDVPSLDAVMFLNPRSSMVDIIQSVGRVMRKSEGKKYGYVMLPIGISANEDPSDALDNNEKYAIVWSVLQALRAHDDRFNNTINKIDLNKRKPEQINVIGIGSDKGEDEDSGKKTKKKTEQIEGQISLNLASLEEWRNSIYAKMVKRVGSRLYWESWAKDVAQIAQAHKDRINLLLTKNVQQINETFENFVEGLKKSLNDTITKEDAIDMLAQHLITKPVFDALFENYEFVKSNPVSKTMQEMMEILDKQALDEEKEKLAKFYESVKERAKGIDNAEGKQKIIIELYDKFFKTALPKEVEKLGIVYTPTECVDFIIHSIESILNEEFNTSLSDKGVHIIDGFAGTGTFIVRLLQSGIIKKENLLYKYTNELHANEIVLLAYYIAAINIEETFHSLAEESNYTPFEGIVLTDTFQLYEDVLDTEYNIDLKNIISPQNNKRANKQKSLPITVCLGNPPYSAGQKSQNDNAQNIKYPLLDERVANTYVANSSAHLKKATYDPYIKAFRWATDRIQNDGIISFITNGKFIENKGMDGFRKCLIDEFNSIYVFNLRGNARTSGEQRRKEKDNVFGQGTRTPVAITLLVKNSKRTKDGFIHYHDIGDYLTQREKLNIISDFKNIKNIPWKEIIPDENNDWLNKKNSNFSKFVPLFEEKNTNSIFTLTTSGVTTARDAWVYNYSKEKLLKNMQNMCDTYNDEMHRLIKNKVDPKEFKNQVTSDETRISWSRSLLNTLKNGKEKEISESNVRQALYRPFCKQWFYFSTDFNECQYKTKSVFKEDNLVIIITGASSGKEFSALMTDTIYNFHTLATSMSFPLYFYEEAKNTDTQISLFENGTSTRKENISDKTLKLFQKEYNDITITKLDIFYYIYAILQSKEYCKTFATDLAKSLPRIPMVKNADLFHEYCSAGKKLADLHVNYENVEPYNKCSIVEDASFGTVTEQQKYHIEKMTFPKRGATQTIILNQYISITDIPKKAYDYQISGKSAIEWVMERYALKEEKKSHIINDPNDWNSLNPKYILNLLLTVINISLQTIDIIDNLPSLELE